MPTENDTDRPAEQRGERSDPSTPRASGHPEGALASPVVAEVYQPRTPWALFVRLFAVYGAFTLGTTGIVVGGWWIGIGPTDDTPPEPKTVVKVERVEVPVEVPVEVQVPVEVPVEVQLPAPPPKVVYVEVPAKAAPVEVKPPEPVAKVEPPKPEVPKPPPPPVAPPEATALNGTYAGRAGSAAATIDLEFLAEGVLRAKVSVEQDGAVVANTVRGQYDLVKGGANVAIFVGDTAYTGVVKGSELTGRVSQGGKNLGKLNVRR